MAIILAASLLFGTLDGSDVDKLAGRAGVEPADLQAAAATVGTDIVTYLRAEGLIATPVVQAAPPSAASSAAVERRLDCIAFYESHNTPTATNTRSGAAGTFQFLWSTWASTPEGRAGRSPYDPAAARSAARWMLAQGRAREWVPVQLGLC